MNNYLSFDGRRLTQLYPNNKNYIYKVDKIINNDRDTQNNYLLFNPSIHYWTALDEIGFDIVDNLEKNKNLDKLKKYLISIYSIDDDTYYKDVIPFLESLVKLGFYTIDNNFSDTGWMSTDFQIDNINNYVFNTIYISLTNQCNLDCLYCFNKESRKKRNRDGNRVILSKDKVIDILFQFKELSGKCVVFTGGEPLLNENFLYYCEQAKSIGLEPRFITNGTLLKHVDTEALVNYVDSFVLSLDSLDQKEVNRLWNTSAYSIENDILFALKKIDQQASLLNKRIRIIIKPTLTCINIQSIKELIENLELKFPNCYLSWDLTCYDKINNKMIDSLLSIDEERYIYSLAFNAQYFYDKNKESNQKINSNRIDKQALQFSLSEGGKKLPHRYPIFFCCAPNFFISSFGDIFPCQGFDDPCFLLGNINDSSLKDAFYNEKFSEIRNNLRINNIEGCKDCEFRFLCSTHCPAKSYLKYNKYSTPENKSYDQCKKRQIQRLWADTQLDT